MKLIKIADTLKTTNEPEPQQLFAAIRPQDRKKFVRTKYIF